MTTYNLHRSLICQTVLPLTRVSLRVVSDDLLIDNANNATNLPCLFFLDVLSLYLFYIVINTLLLNLFTFFWRLIPNLIVLLARQEHAQTRVRSFIISKIVLIINHFTLNLLNLLFFQIHLPLLRTNHFCILRLWRFRLIGHSH